MNLPLPPLDDVRRKLEAAGVRVDGGISVLGDGYEQWAFRAGDLVVRMPKNAARIDIVEKLRREARLSQVIAGRLPLPVPRLTLHESPDGTVFSTHMFIDGAPLWQLERPLAANFGATMGRFLRAMHSIQAAELADTGLTFIDGPALRRRHVENYESVIRRAFPLVSCEARTHVERTMEALINDPSNYQYAPALVHADLDSRNVLGDPGTGGLAAVIDFGDAEIANPVSDYAEVFTAILQHFDAESQLTQLLAGSGIEPETIERRAPFSHLWWPLQDILFGLDSGDQELVEGAIRSLNEVVPFETRC